MSQSNVPEDRSIVPVETPSEVSKNENPLLTYAKQNPLLTLGVVVTIAFLLYFFFMRGSSQVSIKIDSVVEDS